MKNFADITKTALARKTVLALVGVAFAGGAVAGPATSALAADHTPAAKPVAAVVLAGNAKPATPVKPGMDKLSPHGVQGAQSSIDMTPEKLANVKAIIAATKKAGMDERAAVISVATSLQESKLDNIGDLGAANDHDSLGLFQQRPSSGWGTPDQLTNPEYATTAFLNGLKAVNGWHDMNLTDAAQAVQVSAYPDAYAKWESQAAQLVADNWNG